MYLYRTQRGAEPEMELRETEEIIADAEAGKGFLIAKNQIGYWRKANAIHAWFVRNCADNVDNCSPMKVDRVMLEELLHVCRRVLENPYCAEDVLPTQAGFFFGDTDYGEYYMNDVQETIEILERALAEEGDLWYQASW